MSFKKILILLILAAVVAAPIVWKFFDDTKGKQTGQPGKDTARAVAVEAAQVYSRTLPDRKSFTGTLNAYSQFDVTPKITGRLTRMRLRPGAQVTSGQVVAMLDDDEYRLAVEQAAAELDVARAQLDAERRQLDFAQSKFNRSKRLFDGQALSQSQFEQDETAWKTAEANYQVALSLVKQREAALRAANVRLAYCTLTAPANSAEKTYYVARTYVDEGALVAPQTPVLRLVDIDQLRAEIFVIERDYARIDVGMKATLATDAYPGREFPAEVIHISPQIDPASRQAPVELLVPNPELKLKPGMFIRAEIVFDIRENAVVVPFDALSDRNGRQGVFKINPDGDSASFVPVETGIRDGDMIEIVAPPGFSGRVVTLGNYLLGADGGKVIVFDSKHRKTEKNGE